MGVQASVKFTERAEQVAEIAKTYAYRRSHNIDHTGHTVHRLLDAVSALLGQRVIIDATPRVSASAPTNAQAD
jgi:hypothetical protein